MLAVVPFWPAASTFALSSLIKPQHHTHLSHNINTSTVNALFIPRHTADNSNLNVIYENCSFCVSGHQCRGVVCISEENVSQVVDQDNFKDLFLAHFSNHCLVANWQLLDTY